MTERIARLAALVPFGLLGLLAPAAAQDCKTTHEVEITFQGARGFKPRELHVRVGDCVRWVNETHIEHGTLMPGSANVIKFDTPGDVPYTCGPHPPMVGKIVVEP
jgi:plastocyanin